MGPVPSPRDPRAMILSDQGEVLRDPHLDDRGPPNCKNSPLPTREEVPNYAYDRLRAVTTDTTAPYSRIQYQE